MMAPPHRPVGQVGLSLEVMQQLQQLPPSFRQLPGGFPAGSWGTPAAQEGEEAAGEAGLREELQMLLPVAVQRVLLTALNPGGASGSDMGAAARPGAGAGLGADGFGIGAGKAGEQNRSLTGGSCGGGVGGGVGDSGGGWASEISATDEAEMQGGQGAEGAGRGDAEGEVVSGSPGDASVGMQGLMKVRRAGRWGDEVKVGPV